MRGACRLPTLERHTCRLLRLRAKRTKQIPMDKWNKCIHVVLQFVLSFQRNSPFDSECDHESICMRKSLQLVLIVHKWPKRWILRHRARDEMHISSHIVHTACHGMAIFFHSHRKDHVNCALRNNFISFARSPKSQVDFSFYFNLIRSWVQHSATTCLRDGCGCCSWSRAFISAITRTKPMNK